MSGFIKQTVKKIPVVGPFLRRAAGFMQKRPVFVTSGQYWEDRYRVGGNSGAGSYNQLARFKAEVLNELVRINGVQSVTEFGSGDGAQLELARYPKYIGVDVSKQAVKICCGLHKYDKTKTFYHTTEQPADIQSDLTLSLDVIYHLVEDEVYEAYMRQLFGAAKRFVVIYASNENRSWPDLHVRHRKFTDWTEKKATHWALDQFIKNEFPYDERDPRNTSFADFYIFIRDKIDHSRELP